MRKRSIMISRSGDIDLDKENRCNLLWTYLHEPICFQRHIWLTVHYGVWLVEVYVVHSSWWANDENREIHSVVLPARICRGRLYLSRCTSTVGVNFTVGPWGPFWRIHSRSGDRSHRDWLHSFDRSALQPQDVPSPGIFNFYSGSPVPS